MTWTTLSYALLAGILPSLLWLMFWLREDNLHPEPRLVIAITFLLGMLAVAMAVYGEGIASVFISDPSHKYIAWAAIEEISKALAVILVGIFSRQIDEPIDYMLYFLTAALGFAAAENALFLMHPLSIGDTAGSVAIGDFRFIGATLVHTISSALIGFCLGLVYYRGALAKIGMATIGLAGAVAIHSAFNLSVVSAAPSETLQIFAWIWGAVVVMMIFFEEIKGVHNPLSTKGAAKTPTVVQ